MFNSPEDLIMSMRNAQCYHWELYRTYNNNNPTPIATSEHLGKDDTIDPDKSLRLIADTFNVLGPGQYFVKYNTKCYFTKGCFAADVINRQSAISPNVSGGIGAIPSGYVSQDVLTMKMELMKKEFENDQLSKRIGALESGEGSKNTLQQILEYVNSNQHISKGVGDLISSFATKINPQPIQQTATIGTTGFKEKVKPENEATEDDAPEPDHIKALTDEEFEAKQSEILTNAIAIWFIDPDFPALLPKLYQLAKENPGKYNMAKTML